MLLVVTNKTDLACDYLILYLNDRHIPFVRINTEDLDRSFSLDLTVDADGADFLLSPQGHSMLTPNDVDGVYFRQPRPPQLPRDIAPSDREFARREAAETLRSLWRLIDARKWVNHPKNLWLASNKVEQLCVARELGMKIPETIVTSTLSSVRAFMDRHEGKLICKAVKHGFMHGETHTKLAPTQRIGPAFLESFDDFAAVPMIYQREISKAFDVRVTVVGDEVFATAIHSQAHRETEVDWRVWDLCDFDLEHERITLPDEVADNCVRATAYYGLRYSAIDLAHGTDGEYYFLELNPNGQWAWIERQTGQPIRRALTACMGYV